MISVPTYNTYIILEQTHPSQTHKVLLLPLVNQSKFLRVICHGFPNIKEQFLIHDCCLLL